MKQEEKDLRIRALEEEQLSLSAVMRRSDAHASKCIKLGLVYRDTYPQEYEEYEQARVRYNEVEIELEEVRKAEVEEEQAGYDCDGGYPEQPLF